jgi:cytochrome b6-f complex subunit 4
MSQVKHRSEEDSIPFYPDHVSTELKVVIGILVLVVIVGTIGIFFPVGLGLPADPMDTPAHVKPEWYFLGLYQVLKFIPKTAGAMLPVIGVILLAIWPFLDRKPDKSNRIKRVRLSIVVIGMVILIALTIWGELS